MHSHYIWLQIWVSGKETFFDLLFEAITLPLCDDLMSCEKGEKFYNSALTWAEDRL